MSPHQSPLPHGMFWTERGRTWSAPSWWTGSGHYPDALNHWKQNHDQALPKCTESLRTQTGSGHLSKCIKQDPAIYPNASNRIQPFIQMHRTAENINRARSLAKWTEPLLTKTESCHKHWPTEKINRIRSFTKTHWTDENINRIRSFNKMHWTAESINRIRSLSKYSKSVENNGVSWISLSNQPQSPRNTKYFRGTNIYNHWKLKQVIIQTYWTAENINKSRFKLLWISFTVSPLHQPLSLPTFSLFV